MTRLPVMVDAAILPVVQIPKRIRLPHDAYASGEHVFHLVLHALTDTHPFTSPPLSNAIWELVLAEQTRPSIAMKAACLMPDHLHLVVSPGDCDIISWMRSFKSYSTRVSWRFRAGSALWQPSHFDRRIRDEAEFHATVEYVLRNPEAAGLVAEGEDWPWRWAAAEA